jgi:hypothetical protein
LAKIVRPIPGWRCFRLHPSWRCLRLHPLPLALLALSDLVHSRLPKLLSEHSAMASKRSRSPSSATSAPPATSPTLATTTSLALATTSPALATTRALATAAALATSAPATSAPATSALATTTSAQASSSALATSASDAAQLVLERGPQLYRFFRGWPLWRQRQTGTDRANLIRRAYAKSDGIPELRSRRPPGRSKCRKLLGHKWKRQSRIRFSHPPHPANPTTPTAWARIAGNIFHIPGGAASADSCAILAGRHLGGLP